MSEPLYGCIEAGGTKFVVGIVAAPDDIREVVRFDTISPAETIGASVAWLRSAQNRHGALSAIGIASFGPLELDRASANWGYITSTGKPGWSNSDFGGLVGRELDLPVGFDTDVNGAALAEARWGAGQDQNISVYVTVGTGIGGGAIVAGQPLIGLSHPEMGHMLPRRHPDDRQFNGICPFHGDCLEGLASGPAIKARWGVSLSELPVDHEAHAMIAWYLAQLAMTLQSIMEPGRIIFGGGVMATPGLIKGIRENAQQLTNRYFRGDVNDVITLPALGGRAGLLGAFAFAQDIAQV